MMANLEMLMSLSNAKQLLTEVTVTKNDILHSKVLEYDMFVSLSHVNQILQ